MEDAPAEESPNLPNIEGSNPNSNSNLGNIPIDMFVYKDDLVRLKIQPSPREYDLIGIVIAVAGDIDSDVSTSALSDSDTDVEEEDKISRDLDAIIAARCKNGDEIESDNKKTDTDDESYPLADGQIRVSWMDGTFTDEDVSNVEVMDRSFLHGDIVALRSEPTGQLGQIIDVEITVDLLDPHTNTVLKSIPSKNLKRVTELTVGDYVIHDSWLGRVDEVFDNVTVLFDDGSVCKVIRADPLKLKAVSNPLVEEVSFPYYPGQRVKAVSSSVFKASRWLTGLWKATRLEGVVIKVETLAVNVYWIASSSFGTNNAEAPPEEQSLKNLTLVSRFMDVGWRFADWCHLDKSVKKSSIGDENKESEAKTNGDGNGEDNGEDNAGGSGSCFDENGGENEVISSVTISKHQSHENLNAPCRKKSKKVSIRKVDKRAARKKEEHYEKALMIMKTKTVVSVNWQDGTGRSAVDTTSVIPIQTPDEHDYFPHQFVMERSPNETDDLGKRVGVVSCVNAKERTVKLRWISPESRLDPSDPLKNQEVVSAYELELHPDYEYAYGDVVVRLPAPDSNDENSNSNSTLHPREQFIDAVRAKEFSWVGHIVGFDEGSIHVIWADGSNSFVGPQSVYVVGRDGDGESFYSDGPAASWETVDDQDEVENPDDSLNDETNDDNNNNDDYGVDEESETGSNSSNQKEIAKSSTSRGALSVPLAAIGFVTRLATEFFSLGKKRNCETEEAEEAETSSQREDAEKGKEIVVEDGDEEEGLGFKHFDVLQSPEDHHFFFSGGGLGGGKKWVRKVQKEWTILEKNLPECIYVRVFEDRMDLIRAVIVGVPGTPYQDGLFFFDFLLPVEFPFVPPTTYYHSGGLRLNPNLYVDGKVCLSLLNTWSGKGVEVWDPATSTILQVLVSIQGLVLNEKPYFNEAGYDKQVGTLEGEKNFLPYNENTYLLNLKSMLYLLRKPPLCFEEFVRDHFRRRGYYVLKACGAYMEGFAIGSLTSEALPTERSKESSCSVGFKLTLTKLLPRLFTAFKEVGVECEDLEFLLKNGNDTN